MHRRRLWICHSLKGRGRLAVQVQRQGAIINPNDKSGQSFLKKMENTGLYDYMWNATGGKPYDFKKTNGTKKVIGESTEYVYRGMKINTRGKGEVYASARDVGNYAAGMVAGKEHISYQAARLAFDTLESAQKRELTTEGLILKKQRKKDGQIIIIIKRHMNYYKICCGRFYIM